MVFGRYDQPKVDPEHLPQIKQSTKIESGQLNLEVVVPVVPGNFLSYLSVVVGFPSKHGIERRPLGPLSFRQASESLPNPCPQGTEYTQQEQAWWETMTTTCRARSWCLAWFSLVGRTAAIVTPLLLSAWLSDVRTSASTHHPLQCLLDDRYRSDRSTSCCWCAR